MSNDERLLGRLEEFKEVSERRFDNLEYGVHTLGKKIDALNEFKWRMTGYKISDRMVGDSRRVKRSWMYF